MKNFLTIISIVFISLFSFSQPPAPPVDNSLINGNMYIDLPPGVWLRAEDSKVPENITQNDPNLGAEVRRVFWIHGLGGDASAWSKPAEASEDMSFNEVGPQEP